MKKYLHWIFPQQLLNKVRHHTHGRIKYVTIVFENGVYVCFHEDILDKDFIKNIDKYIK